MARHVRYKTFDQLSFVDNVMYSKLPPHSFWSQVDQQIDFSFADDLCAVLYTGRGQRPFAPSLKLKVHLVQSYYRLSDRLVEEKIIGDLFIKRFLGLPADFFGFDHSTIGLDRQRLGTAMFEACHLMVLAQLYQLGLWGDREEHWILDSFPANAGVALVGSYRLIQQCMLRLVRHIQKNHSALYAWAGQTLTLDAMTFQLPSSASSADRMLAFSKLVAQAHALLHGLESDSAAALASGWKSEQARERSVQLQAILKQVLAENSRPTPPEKLDSSTEVGEAAASASDETPTASVADSEAVAEQRAGEAAPTEAILFEKIPATERPAHRIICAHDPQARRSAKGLQILKSFKVQTLCTCSGLILNAKAIPASEADGLAMLDMMRGIQTFFHLTPRAMVGDTAYGYGPQRVEFAAWGVPLVAPIKPLSVTEGKFPLTAFVYDKQRDVYRCPNGKESVRKTHNAKLEGTQYRFGQNACDDCPLREKCTTSVQGRSVFRSDYADHFEQAKAFNATDDGRYLLRTRMVVERKNQELKNDCGLGAPNTRSQAGLDIKAKLTAIIVNLKYAIRRLSNPKPGFLRRAPQA